MYLLPGLYLVLASTPVTVIRICTTGMERKMAIVVNS